MFCFGHEHSNQTIHFIHRQKRPINGQRETEFTHRLPTPTPSTGPAPFFVTAAADCSSPEGNTPKIPWAVFCNKNLKIFGPRPFRAGCECSNIQYRLRIQTDRTLPPELDRRHADSNKGASPRVQNDSPSKKFFFGSSVADPHHLIPLPNCRSQTSI